MFFLPLIPRNAVVVGRNELDRLKDRITDLRQEVRRH
jgi:Na+-translocating ferredoxin:NAD+ oxidoreductase RnfE subunit